MSVKSEAEETLVLHLRAVGIEAEREYRFHPERQWRFDFAIPALKLAIEVQGGTFAFRDKAGEMVVGRHSRGAGYENDCIKHAEAMCLGWRVLIVTTRMVNDGRALQYVERIAGLSVNFL